MRKIFFLVLFILSLVPARAQFVNGVGVMGGVTFAKQKWHFTETDVTQKKKFRFGFNACVFAEFLSGDYIRWISEIQFNQKGCVSKDSVKYKNRINYICWNNYLKFRYELFGGVPYILIGPRLEYRFSQATQSPEITGNFKTLQLSPSVGAGYEFVVYSSLKPFVEIHYNPDIKLYAYDENNLEILNRAWELRVGFKYTFDNSSAESCPPVYR